MIALKNEKFGLMKTLLDAHTMGVYAAAALLKDCGYDVVISPVQIESALDKIEDENSQRLILKWIIENNIKILKKHLTFLSMCATMDVVGTKSTNRIRI